MLFSSIISFGSNNNKLFIIIKLQILKLLRNYKWNKKYKKTAKTRKFKILKFYAKNIESLKFDSIIENTYLFVL
jgi:hypothetical protein